MDGKEALYHLRLLLNEDTNSGLLDDRTSYRFLWEAATKFVDRTQCLQSSQTITTVADQAEYDLNADYLRPALRNRDNLYFIKYSDGTTNHFLYQRDYGQITFEDNTTSELIPSYWTVIDAALDTQLTGSATSTGAASGGQCTLTASAADFTTASPGDIVHNLTDGSDGIVLSKTSTTVLVTALFGGTNNDWSVSDSFVIQPQGRMQLILDPAPSTAGHTVTFNYIQRPAPVFSSYGVYRIQDQYMSACVDFAAWRYRYKDRQPEYGDPLYQHFTEAVKRAGSATNHAMQRTKVSVNFKARRR